MDALALLSDDEDGPPEDDVEEATEPETKRQKTPQLDFAALQRVGFASGTSELDEDVAAAASLSNSVPSMQRATKSDSTGLPKGQGILGLSHKHTTPSMPCGSNLTSAKKSSAGCVPIQSQTVHFVPRSPRQPHRAAASCRRNRLFSPGMVSSFPCPRRLSMVSADQGALISSCSVLGKRLLVGSKVALACASAKRGSSTYRVMRAMARKVCKNGEFGRMRIFSL